MPTVFTVVDASQFKRGELLLLGGESRVRVWWRHGNTVTVVAPGSWRYRWLRFEGWAIHAWRYLKPRAFSVCCRVVGHRWVVPAPPNATEGTLPPFSELERWYESTFPRCGRCGSPEPGKYGPQ